LSLLHLRGSAAGLLVAVFGWATGCAVAPHPMVDPGYAARAYTPLRVAVLPPDVFVVIDQVGDNDPMQSAALGQQVSAEMVHVAEQTLRARGYDVDLSARWDGIVGQDGTVLVSRDELGGLANGVLAFANSRAGGPAATLGTPQVVAPDLAGKVGWATQSDAVLYLNVKGAVTTPGKQTASILAGVFIIVVILAVIVAMAASSKNGGGGGGSGWGHASGGGASRSGSVARAPAPGTWRGTPVSGGGSGWHGTPTTPPIAGGGSGWHGTPPGTAGAAPRATPAPAGGWRGAGTAPGAPRGGPVYTGGGPHVGFGIGVVVPLDGPVYTHDGSVDYEDPMFAGDQLYVSMTLVSTYDGRVLWHARQDVDLEANRPEQIDQMMHAFLDTLPPALPRAR
jgi:hypothetical protein